MNTIRKQRGVSILGWFVIIVMVAIIGTGALKLAPVYLEFYNIVSIVENMQNEPGLKGATRQEIITTFGKRLSVNSIRDIKKDDYDVKRIEGRKGYEFRVHYEARRSLMGNLSIVATFDRTFEVGG